MLKLFINTFEFLFRAWLSNFEAYKIQDWLVLIVYQNLKVRYQQLQTMYGKDQVNLQGDLKCHQFRHLGRLWQNFLVFYGLSNGVFPKWPKKPKPTSCNKRQAVFLAGHLDLRILIVFQLANIQVSLHLRCLICNF